MASLTKLRVPGAWRVREPHSGHLRIPFVQRCVLQGMQGTRDALICDLSAAGLYVAIDPVPEVETLFRLALQLPGDDPLDADATVAWRNVGPNPRIPELPVGCGLRFIDLSTRDRERIEGLVKAYTATLPPTN
jgi:hypothetical protein